MLIIDKNKEVFEWITSLHNDQIGAAHLDINTFEVANGIETELIMMSSTMFNELSSVQRKKLETCTALILFNLNSKPITNFIIILKKEEVFIN